MLPSWSARPHVNIVFGQPGERTQWGLASGVVWLDCGVAPVHDPDPYPGLRRLTPTHCVRQGGGGLACGTGFGVLTDGACRCFFQEKAPKPFASDDLHHRSSAQTSPCRWSMGPRTCPQGPLNPSDTQIHEGGRWAPSHSCPKSTGVRPGGATTTGPDATHPPTIFQTSGGGGGCWGGGSRWGSGGGVFLPGVGGGGCSCRGSGGVWPGVMGASSQG